MAEVRWGLLGYCWMNEWASREKRHAVEDWMALKKMNMTDIYRKKWEQERFKEGKEKKNRRRNRVREEKQKLGGRKGHDRYVLFFWGKNIVNTIWIPYCFSHVFAHDCARVWECVTDHITPSKDLGLTSGGQDLTPLLSPPTHHQPAHIFSHSHWRTSIKATKACTLRSTPAVIGLLTVPLKHV